MEYRSSLKKRVERLKSDRLFEKTECENTKMQAYYRDMVRDAVANAELDQINRYGLQMFYTAGMEQVYYSRDLDCFICIELDGDVLFLNSIISRNRIDLKAILERIPVDYKELILGFTPLPEYSNLFIREEYDGGDDYRLFYLGEALESIEKDKLHFPVYSHA